MFPRKVNQGVIELDKFLKAVRVNFEKGLTVEQVKNIIAEKYPNVVISYSEKVSKNSKYLPKDAIVILSGFGLSEAKCDCIKRFLEYRYAQHKFKYTEIALKGLFKKIEDCPIDNLSEAVDHSISSGYMALIIKESKKDSKKLNKFNDEPI